MKVALITDTHDNSPVVVEIIEQLNEQGIMTVFHAGDIINPGIVRRFRDHYEGTMHFVFGNNDGEIAGITAMAEQAENLVCHNREMDEEFEGKKLFMNHYTYIGKSVAANETYDLVIGGHTHKYEVEKFGQSLFVNPGNTVTKDKWLQSPEWEGISSYVVIDLETMELEQIVLEKSND